MKIAFLGTPSFAVTSLRALQGTKHHKVVCVVTQPDKPSGRGKELAISPVKAFALQHNIPVFQPEKISREIETLFAKIEKPDIIVTCAFGQILRQNVIDYCRFGVVNVHASILPKYRGASPVNYMLINGEKIGGVTIMQTDIGIDTGDTFMTVETPIGDTETAGELLDRLAPIGAEALVKTLDAIENGTAKRTPQNHSQSSYYPMIKKSDGKIDFHKSPREIVNFVRGMSPWPCAWADSTHGIIRVHKAHLDPNGELAIDLVQGSGSRTMPFRDFLNGHKGFGWKK